MQRFASRACAALMVLLILALSPATPPGGCDRCLPDCPMHATVATDTPQLPCHQAEMAHDGDDIECLMRAVCGHEGAAGPVVRVLLPDMQRVRHTVVSGGISLAASARPIAPPRQPLTAPPRSAVA